MNKWTLQESIAICRMIESVCPKFGCHVALTGGVLYKDGPRKDLDLILYRIRQAREINFDGLFIALREIGITDSDGGGWIYKAKFGTKRIDFMSPEEQGDEYPVDEDETSDTPKAVALVDFQ